MNQEATNRLNNQQSERFRQEQRAAEDRQTEERQRSEERARAERSTQEQRMRDEDRLRDEQRRQEDSRRHEDERRRTEQQRQESNRGRESQKREQDVAAEAKMHESTAKTLSDKGQENQQAQYTREKGVPYVSTNYVVNQYYRNANAQNKAQHGIDGKPLSEGQFMQLHTEKAAERTAPDKVAAPDKGQRNVSPAMEKYRAHEQTLGGKVQERLASQSHGQPISQGK